MSALMCRRCPVTALPVRLTPGGSWTSPPGWAHVTVAGVPVVNVVLCPAHAAEAVDYLTTGADTAQAQLDAKIEAAFARGYDAGLSEPRIQLEGKAAPEPHLRVVP